MSRDEAAQLSRLGVGADVAVLSRSARPIRDRAHLRKALKLAAVELLELGQ